MSVVELLPRRFMNLYSAVASRKPAFAFGRDPHSCLFSYRREVNRQIYGRRRALMYMQLVVARESLPRPTRHGSVLLRHVAMVSRGEN